MIYDIGGKGTNNYAKKKENACFSLKTSPACSRISLQAGLSINDLSSYIFTIRCPKCRYRE